MNPRSSLLLVVLGTAFSLLPVQTSRARQGQEVPEIESFALASDREEVLRNLVPGSEMDFYLRCLHAQNLQKFAEVGPLLEQWSRQYGQTSQWRTIRNRQAVLTLDSDPAAAVSVLQQELGLNFAHTRRLPPAGQNLPSVLDANLISIETLVARGLSVDDRFSWLTDLALEEVADQAASFPAGKKRAFLARLQWPDYPGLVDLVIDELRDRESGGFGSLPIHSRLTESQLRECLAKFPELGNHSGFVQACLRQMQSDPVPVPDTWASRIAELDRMLEFLRPLPAAQNSLKAAVLHERLRWGSLQGEYPVDLLIEYLKLPREQGYMHPAILKRMPPREQWVDLGADFSGVLRCPPVYSDVELVSAFLQQVLRDSAKQEQFRELLSKEFLEEQLAIAQVLSGQGDASRWSAVLGPARLKELVERVDLDFHAVHRLWYAPDEAVSVDLRIKNVSGLMVRIFELNTLNCYRNAAGPISADISLDGLVPNHERQIPRSQLPAIQTVERIELPELDHRGVYVVDFIGGGKNCRALIHKGRWTCVGQPVVDGQEFRVLDEAGKVLSPASLWLEGRRFEADEKGRILVPFSNSPGMQPVILEHDGFASVAEAMIATESWSLDAGLQVDRESLLPGQKARVLIRPSLRVAGVPVPAQGTLDNLRVRMNALTLDGDAAVREFRDLVIDERGELTLEFVVPLRLRTLGLQLTGEVKVASRGNAVEQLSSGMELEINRIDSSSEIACAHLLRNREDYWVEVLGRNGEPRRNWPVSVRLQSIWSPQPVDLSMQTDENGRLVLGLLTGIQQVAVTPVHCSEQAWELANQDFQSFPSTLTVRAGEAWQLPGPPESRALAERKPKLFQLAEGGLRRQLEGAVRAEGGWLRGAPLDAGDYVVVLPDLRQIRIWSVAGTGVGGAIANPLMAARLPSTTAPALELVESAGDQLRIRVGNAGESTRVHVIASRYVPSFPAGRALGTIRDNPASRTFFRWDGSRYVSARQLGDEYLYILNRKGLPRLAGNMLERPSLLLSPWSLGPTENQTEQLQRDDPRGTGLAMDSESKSDQGGEDASLAGANRDWANLDWLDSGSVVLANLRPDADGNLSVELAEFGDKQHLTIILADLFSTTVVAHPLAARPLQPRDLRLLAPLGSDQHLSLEKQSGVLLAGEEFRLQDLLTARFEAVDDLGDAWRHLLALAPDGELARFAFLSRWETLAVPEQEQLYAGHACHEVNYYLYRKDRAFFDRVIAPLIRNRHSAGFMDEWLLDRNLQAWTDPWRFRQLNGFEQILLAQKLPEARAGILRNIEEQWQGLPDDLMLRDRLFEAVMAGSALEEDDVARQLREAVASDEGRSQTEGGLAAADAPSPATGSAEFFSAPAENKPGSNYGFGSGGGGGRGAEQPGVAGIPGGAAEPRGLKRRGRVGEAMDQKDKSGMADRLEAGDADRDGVELAEEMAGKSVSPRFRTDEEFWDRGRPAGPADPVDTGRFYQAIGTTERWVESGYWRIPGTSSTADRVPINRYWRNYAARSGNEPFLDPEFLQCHRNTSDSLFALAVLDLAGKAPEPGTGIADGQLTWTSEVAAIMYHQQLRPLPTDPGATRIMVSENFFDAAERYQQIENRQVDRFVSGPYYTDRLYGAQVVVTNPTSSPQTVSLLVQVPEGALAVSGSKTTRTLQLDLPAFGSANHEYWFYFPAAGNFSHFPAHAADGGRILAWANPTRFEVTGEPAGVDREAWSHVSQNADDDQLLAWMETHNLQQVDLADIAFRMQDRRMFERVTSLLAARLLYHPVLWSYALLHRDLDRAGEYLANEEDFVRSCGPCLECGWLILQPELRRWYEHIEFSPLVNARSHQTGARRKILNDSLLQQYRSLLEILAFRARFDDDDRMAVVCFLLVQERIPEAMEWLEKVDPAGVSGSMQYDYARAWLALTGSRPEEAREIANRYVSYPVPAWQKRFAAVLAVVEEAAGDGARIVDPDNTAQQQAAAASSMPSLEVTTEGEQLTIDYRNLAEAVIEYHELDVELQFSRDPFSRGAEGGHSMVRPNQTETVRLPADGNRLVHPLPESLRRKNLLIGIKGGDRTVTRTVYANDLDLQLVPAMGQLQVRTRSDGKVLSGSYVKVYAETLDGRTEFYKDGYTDLRGRFDYTTQSNFPLDSVQRFSVLVLTDEHGCAIRLTETPRR